MSRQQILEKRNMEIKEVFSHLRKKRRHETAFVLQVIRSNYFLSVDRIYRIISTDFQEPFNPSQASITYREIVDNNNYYALETA